MLPPFRLTVANRVSGLGASVKHCTNGDDDALDGRFVEELGCLGRRTRSDGKRRIFHLVVRHDKTRFPRCSVEGVVLHLVSYLVYSPWMLDLTIFVTRLQSVVSQRCEKLSRLGNEIWEMARARQVVVESGSGVR